MNGIIWWVLRIGDLQDIMDFNFKMIIHDLDDLKVPAFGKLHMSICKMDTLDTIGSYERIE